MSEAKLPESKGTVPGLARSILGLLGFSALAAILIVALAAPALVVTSQVTNNAAGLFENLPDYVKIGNQSQRNILYGLRGGAQVPFAQVYDQNRQEVAWDAVSPFAKDALVAAEDVRFYSHGGVDLAGIARAAVNNITGNDLQGASSIEQQLVKQLAIQDAIATISDKKKLEAAKAKAQANTLDRKLKEAKLASASRRTTRSTRSCWPISTSPDLVGTPMESRRLPSSTIPRPPRNSHWLKPRASSPSCSSRPCATRAPRPTGSATCPGVTRYSPP